MLRIRTAPPQRRCGPEKHDSHDCAKRCVPKALCAQRSAPEALYLMWTRYSEFLRTPPELTLDWRDAETGARGWLVINSHRGGAAGGGTRMRVGVTPAEVTYLAKTMELKFALAGPPIGGAKTGIDFDPR